MTPTSQRQYMMEIESLRQLLAECERERDDFERKWLASLKVAEVVRLEEELSALQAKYDEVVKDADRYSFLRNDPPLILSVRRRAGEWPNCDYVYLDQENLDRAIDAAIAKLGADKTGEV